MINIKLLEDQHQVTGGRAGTRCTYIIGSMTWLQHATGCDTDNGFASLMAQRQGRWLRSTLQKTKRQLSAEKVGLVSLCTELSGLQALPTQQSQMPAPMQEARGLVSGESKPERLRMQRPRQSREQWRGSGLRPGAHNTGIASVYSQTACFQLLFGC